MLRNYFIIALRNFTRQPLFSSINLGGLALGLCVVMLIALFVAAELRYDDFHVSADRMYRVGIWDKGESGVSRSAKSCAPLLENLAATIPEIESGTRFGIWKDVPALIHEEKHTLPSLLVADANFFSFFTFPIIRGNPATVLTGTNKVVITEAAAGKYFGSWDPIGQTFEITTHGKKKIVEVTGIAQNPPSRSHLQFEFILSGESWPYLSGDYWLNAQNYTYVKTFSPVAAGMLERKITEITTAPMAKDIASVLGYSFEKFKAGGGDIGFFVQPLRKIYLHSAVDDELSPNGSIDYIYIFIGVALLVLVMAIINYVNLYTARSATRAKEVGIRKTSGAVSRTLRLQFIVESLLFVLFAAIVGVALAAALVPMLTAITEKPLQAQEIITPSMIVATLVAVVLIGVLAGAYPALYLSGFRPAEVLKGKARAGLRATAFRNYLIVFQFSIVIILITSSLVMSRQLRFISDKDLGFEKENVIVVRKADQLGGRGQGFVQELLARTEVISASFSNEVPPYIEETGGFRAPGTERDVMLSVFQTDANMLKTLGLTMKQGRFFSDTHSSDSAAVILNEAAMKLLGWDNVENQSLVTYFRGLEPRELHLIGVVDDFHYRMLYDEIRPLAILKGPESNTMLTLRIQKGAQRDAITKLEELWKKSDTAGSLDYAFLDETIQRAYARDRQNTTIMTGFTVLSIVIAVLGLLGLACYVVEQRTKEISLRIILGGSRMGMLMLLNRDFLRLVIISFALSSPAAFFLLNQWLQKFPYRREIDMLTLALPGAALLLLTLLVVSLQSWNATRQNPSSYLARE